MATGRSTGRYGHLLVPDIAANSGKGDASCLFAIGPIISSNHCEATSKNLPDGLHWNTMLNVTGGCFCLPVRASLPPVINPYELFTYSDNLYLGNIAGNAWLKIGAYESGWGWERVGDTLVCYINGSMVEEITETYHAIYNSHGNKMIHIDRESGTIYTRGQIETGGLNFPV